MQQYQDINGKTGIRNLQGTRFLYTNVSLLSPDELTSALQDGLTNYTPPAKPIPTDSFLLEQAKIVKASSIRGGFDYYLSLGVTDGNAVKWDAGFDTAIKLDGARRFAETFGMTTVDLFDYNNQLHNSTLAEALAVIGLVAGDYQRVLAIKNGLYGDTEFI